MKKHTDSGFTFDIKEDHAAVIEIDGNPQIVEIPEQIDGVPVTELAEYLFSGKVPVCCPAGQRACPPSSPAASYSAGPARSPAWSCPFHR